MKRRQLDNGAVIFRQRSPHGDGWIYFIDGGCEGLVQIMDTYMTPISIVSQCLAWELDSDKQGDNKPHIKPVFDRKGWTF